MFNSYSEEFKINTVAVVRSGYGIETLAKRLNIPPTSIRNWLTRPKYAAVKPADEEILSKVPERRLEPKDLVKSGDTSVFINKNCLPEMEIKIGNAAIKVPKNISRPIEIRTTWLSFYSSVIIASSARKTSKIMSAWLDDKRT